MERLKGCTLYWSDDGRFAIITDNENKKEMEKECFHAWWKSKREFQNQLRALEFIVAEFNIIIKKIEVNRDQAVQVLNFTDWI